MPANPQFDPDHDRHGRRRRTPAAGPPASRSLTPPCEFDRPSIRVAMAASLLRHGHEPLRAAEITRVPLALVQLIADHLTRP